MEKKQAVYYPGKQSQINNNAPLKKAEIKSQIHAPLDPKKQAEIQSKRQEAYKTTGAGANNKIVDRNQKNTKDKDCIIY